MQIHDQIKSTLKNTGLTFTDHHNSFSSQWKISPKTMIRVIVTYGIHPDWVHILCDVGTLQNYVKDTCLTLLRINNMVAGSKFTLSQDQRIICSAELLLTHLTEDQLKKQITQVVKMVSLFYEEVEKENLKLNSE